jgi:Na+-transporting methylmalonyl-CoA/oxaloacetate decarboxylase gamma subunit
MHALALLAAAAAKPSIWGTFLAAFPHLLGMLVVMITLAILWGVCVLTARLIRTLVPEPVAAVAAPVPPAEASSHATSAGPVATSTVPPQIVAVIAAAVHTAVGKGHTIVSITPQDSNWEKAGRQSVLSSHRLR